MSKSRHWLVQVATRAEIVGAESLVLDQWVSVSEAWEAVGRLCGVGDEELAEHVAAAYKLPVANLETAEPQALNLIPDKLAHKHNVFPIRQSDGQLVVATSDPTDLDIEQDVRFASGRAPIMEVAPPSLIAQAITAHYSPDRALQKLLSAVDPGTGGSVRVIRDMEPEGVSSEQAESGPAVRLVDLILRNAVAQNASDIHIGPAANTAKVRFRIDGCLRHYMQLPLPTLSRVISRIKILGGIDITNRLQPQDGSAQMEVDGRTCDLRISTVPTRRTEKAVIRVLDSQGATRLEGLSLSGPEVQSIQSLVSNHQGIVFVTGPTGSGKTTTLYAVLQEVSGDEVNVMTVEDPVEYDLPSTTQIQVDPKQGVTFSSALRAILRQDPDVILIGEIRDTETARVAVQASMTGHLVLATVHTNNAIGCFRRCVDLGLDPASIVETLRGATAQRLIRKVCTECSVTVDGPLTAEESRLEAAYGVRPTVRTRGCEGCGHTGYRGRFPVAEVFTMNARLEKLVLEGAAPSLLHSAAVESGMRPLVQTALDSVRAGQTTLQELERVLSDSPAQDEPEDRRLGQESRTVVTNTSRKSSQSEAALEKPVRGIDEAAAEELGSVEPARILLVDDDPVNRTIARTLLEAENFQISESADGDEALELLKIEPDFDLMVLDIDMPKLGGREVLARVRASVSTASLSIIVLTGSGDAEDEVNLMKEGADDYIRKPIDPPRFTARVMAALRRAGG